MVEALIAILPTLLAIFGFIAKEHFSEEGKYKRKAYEREKEIANKDHAAISKRLSDRLDAARLRKKNRSNTG